MTIMKKKVAIVGGGFSGIAAFTCLKEEGHDPFCFESTDKLGGTWNYKETSIAGQASIMPTTVANNSKEMGAVSNFPPRKEFNAFMRHKQLLEYITDYAKCTDIDRHIRYNTEVLLIQKTGDYDQTGQFLVTVKNNVTGEVSTDVFDGVIVATGHFTYPNMPMFPGLKKFKGNVMHTHSLKHVDQFIGNNVLIIGNGCSGLDAAEAISCVAQKVYLSTRSGFFFLSKKGPSGYPIDYLLLRRFLVWALSYLPLWICSWYLNTFYADPYFDHRLFYVKPQYHWLSKDPVFSDTISSKLLNGYVIQKGKVDCFTEGGVIFDGEHVATNIDTVIMATGYDFKFPFLDKGLIEIENSTINLYKCMYPTHLSHATLSFIGFINSLGPGIPVLEIQSRHTALVFSDKIKLPSTEKMMKDVIHRKNENEKRYPPSPFQSVRIDFVQYMDNLASDIGCMPSLLKYIFTDFILFIYLMFGPSLPYQYRLQGPHKWDGARNAIMTSRQRLIYPLVKGDMPRKGVLEVVMEFILNMISKMFGF